MLCLHGISFDRTDFHEKFHSARQPTFDNSKLSPTCNANYNETIAREVNHM